MEFIAIILLLAFLVVAYPIIQGQRERALEKRLEKLKDPSMAAVEVDLATEQSRREAVALKKLRPGL